MTTIYALVGGGIALIPTYLGITAAGRRLIDWVDEHTNTTTAPIRPRRQPIAAITAQPHYEAVDDLGPWNPSQHELVDAHLYNALAGGAR